ncbi:MAG: type II secretion system protein, partial [Colwellia sp.]|nr:type II secretion system protein [Colwellia sp.]
KETLPRNSTTGAWITPVVSTTVGNSFTYQAANSRVIIYVNN